VTLNALDRLGDAAVAHPVAAEAELVDGDFVAVDVADDFALVLLAGGAATDCSDLLAHFGSLGGVWLVRIWLGLALGLRTEILDGRGKYLLIQLRGVSEDAMPLVQISERMLLVDDLRQLAFDESKNQDSEGFVVEMK
jgi:hypothetical protein